MGRALLKDGAKSTGGIEFWDGSGLWGRHHSRRPPIYFSCKVGVAQTDVGVAQFKVGVARATPT